MYRDLSEQQDKALKDLLILQAELEESLKEASTLKWEHANLVEKVKVFEVENKLLVVVTNNITLQVQQNIDLIDQLRDYGRGQGPDRSVEGQDRSSGLGQGSRKDNVGINREPTLGGEAESRQMVLFERKFWAQQRSTIT